MPIGEFANFDACDSLPANHPERKSRGVTKENVS